MSRDYERWKECKRIFKAPWVIKYWENITDEKQYELSKIVQKRLLIIMIPVTTFLGVYLGWLLFG